MLLLPSGPDAVMIELATAGEVAAVRAAVLLAGLPEVVDVVPAARTVLVSCAPGAGTAGVRGLLDGVSPGDLPAPRGRHVTLPVTYDGPDLELVARTAGLTTAEVVALHTGAEYAVAFCGFAPGFGYLTGLPEPLRQPRLDSPRATVPAGSVGVAGEYTGAYPRASPGGWRLLGRTAVTLFDPGRERPALLAPGDRVRFAAAS
ncbi:MAG TPA: 5-oxoprolinase subunit PxpB [Pseudonocardiaceae bacterium]